nr:SDR family oxidoreductase [Pseudomonas sp.]
RMPAGRLGEPRDIGYCVLYLSADTGRYVTGASIPVDGGMTVNLF